MNYYRCECGKRESWSSYGPFRCKPCPECGTTLGSGPDDHPPVEPHRWEEWRWTIDEKTGERSQRRECTACMTKETRSAPALAPTRASVEAAILRVRELWQSSLDGWESEKVEPSPTHGPPELRLAYLEGRWKGLGDALVHLYALLGPAGVPANEQAIRDKAFCEVVNVLRTQFIEGSPMGRQYENAAQTVRGLLGKSTAEIDAILAERPESGVPANGAGETRSGLSGVNAQNTSPREDR